MSDEESDLKTVTVRVSVFDGNRLLFVSVHGCTTHHNYADVINSVAFKNAKIVTINPKNVTLEHVAEDGAVTTLKPDQLVDESKLLLGMQIAYSKRMLVTCSNLKEDKPIHKVASIMFMSLSRTDDLDVLEAGNKVGDGYVLWVFRCSF